MTQLVKGLMYKPEDLCSDTQGMVGLAPITLLHSGGDTRVHGVHWLTRLAESWL